MTVIRLIAGVVSAALYASETVAYQPLQFLHTSSNHAMVANMFSYPRMKCIAITAISTTEKEESAVSKTKEKEMNSGLFRKISQSNKNFDYEEILSAEDVDEYQKRFHSLMVLFPHVRETELRTLVFTSPLLLALETANLKKAVNRLESDLPFIDPSYVISQRSCGLDLLLSCMSPLFDLETRRNDVISVIGKERNVTEFLRRVPHCLTPRYLLALRDHCIVMKEYLNLDSKSSLDMVERWPGILGIDLVTSLSRFNASLHRLELVPAHETGTFFLTKILRAVPRALMQDMPRRAYLLRQNFPLWDLPTIIQKYPRILTQKIQGLKGHYEILKEVLDPLEISSDNLVNIFPRSLGYNPQSLLAGAHNIAKLLPGLSVHDVYKRVPRLLSVRTRETLQPQIFRLQKSFQTNDVENNGKVTSDQQNNRKFGHEKTDNPKIPEYRNSNTAGSGSLHHLIEAEDSTDDDDDYYLAELHNSDPSDMRNKVHVVKLLAQMKSKEIETMNLESKTHLSKKTNSKIDVIPQIRPKDNVEIILKTRSNDTGDLHQNTVKPSNIIASPTVLSNHDTVSNVNDHQITVKSLSRIIKENENEEGNDKNDNSDEINVTRIIVGNLDSFIDRYPYFMEKVNGWVKMVTVPCSSCCRVIPDDEVLFILQQAGYNVARAADSVRKMAKKLLECQWSESDISALLDSGCVLQGNVRGLVAHMKQHRSTIRTAHTIYYYTRLRKDHIVVNSKELNDINHSVTSGTTAVSIVTTSAKPKEKEKEKEKEREKEKEKEREKEKEKEKEKGKEKEKECDALSNPSNALLADHLRKPLQRDRPTICAIFRYADLMLGREDEGGTMERKVQGPPRGNLLPSKRSYPASVPVNQCADISTSGGVGNGSVGSSAGLKASEIDCAGVGEGLGVDALGSKSASSNSNTKSNSNSKSSDGSSKCSGVLLATVETISGAGKGKRISTAKDSKRADILQSPMGPIRDLPPVVDMTPFLKLFLEASRQNK